MVARILMQRSVLEGDAKDRQACSEREQEHDSRFWNNVRLQAIQDDEIARVSKARDRVCKMPPVPIENTAFIRRAEHERDPHYRPGLRARIMKSFGEDGILPAQRGDLEVSRALSRVFHMLDEPTAFLRDPAVMARILKIWALPTSLKRARGWYPPKFGPDRAEMFATLGLAA